MLKFKNIGYALLSMVLLISTLGVSVNRHYCLGILVDESYYLPTEGCPSMEEDACFSTEVHSHKSCCDDEQILIPGLEVQQQLKEEFTIANNFIVPQPHYQILENSFYNHKVKSVHTLPRPPSLPTNGRTILTDVQRFII